VVDVVVDVVGRGEQKTNYVVVCLKDCCC